MSKRFLKLPPDVLSKRFLKLPSKYAEYIQSLRYRAIDAVIKRQIGVPEREDDIEEIVYSFIELTTPPPGKKPREIAKLVDEGITAKVEAGMPLDEAVPYIRKFYATMYGKSVAAVKVAHLRHGTVGVTKK
jgi:hypothetical protein